MKKCYVIEKETGEIIDDNFKIYNLEDTLKQKEAINKIKSNNEFYQYIDVNYGNFYFIFNKMIDKNILRQYMTRFIYLCTYMDYNNNLLFGKTKGDGKYMLEKDLKEVLRLSKTETNKTKKYLINNNLIISDKNRRLKVNKNWCSKGKLKSSEINKSKTRIFEKGIRELYENSLPREHKKIALFLEILPYINLKYNVVCSNPKCEKIEEIIPISLTKLSKILNFSTVQKFKNGLFDMTIQNENIIGIFTIKNKSMIFINPKIYYKGTKIEDCKFLNNIFELSKKI